MGSFFSTQNIFQKHYTSLLNGKWMESRNLRLNVKRPPWCPLVYAGDWVERKAGRLISRTIARQQRVHGDSMAIPWQQIFIETKQKVLITVLIACLELEYKNGRTCWCEMEPSGLENRTKICYRRFDWKLERGAKSGKWRKFITLIPPIWFDFLSIGTTETIKNCKRYY